MNSIRRVLAIGLALVVILSMCALPASASDLTSKLNGDHTERNLVLIGDSRTTGMDYAVTGNNIVATIRIDRYGTWSAQGGARYEWFRDTGIPRAKKYLKKNTSVIILMGYNDIAAHSAKPSQYYNLINKKAAAWKKYGVDVYYVSVNPAGSVRNCPAKYERRNKQIENWNKKMKKGLSDDVTYIDIYDRIKRNFTTVDNIHYDDDTYCKIYNLIIARINLAHPTQYREFAD